MSQTVRSREASERVRTPLSEWPESVTRPPVTDRIGSPLDPFSLSYQADVAYTLEVSLRGTVPTSVCEYIRRQRHQGVSSLVLAEELELSGTQVRYHASGCCGHRELVPPSHGKISRWLCACWRRRKQLGDGSETIAENSPVEVDPRAVRAHVSGECSHDHGLVEPVVREYVSESACQAWRRRYDGNIREVSRTVDEWGYCTVRNHVRGDCEHDPEGATEALADRGWTAAVDGGEDSDE